MRLRWRRKADRAKIVVFVDGVERPVWALRAGQRIVATDYSHPHRMTVWVESAPAEIISGVWDGTTWCSTAHESESE